MELVGAVGLTNQGQVAEVPVHVVVTRWDIGEGNRECAYTCPVALAIRKKTGLAVAVGQTMLVFEDAQTGKPLERPSPRIVAEFVEAFDKGAHVEPIAFDVFVPAAALDLGMYRPATSVVEEERCA